jgi:hypothetical protein
MKRFFNVTGLCNPEKHYMVDPLRGLNNTILEVNQISNSIGIT